MSDTTSLSDLALAALITYGPIALALTLLLGAAGAPLPGALVLIAAGAFARQDFIDWRWAAAAGLAGVVLGDIVAYGIGRVGGVWAEKRMAHMSAWQSATDQFARHGGWAIFLTRFLLTPLGVPMSIIAGIAAYPFYRFVLVDTAGELLWISIYGGAGYALGSQWQVATQFISDFSGLIVGVAVLTVGVVLAVRQLRRRGAPRPIPAAAAHVAEQQPAD